MASVSTIRVYGDGFEMFKHVSHAVRPVEEMSIIAFIIFALLCICVSGTTNPNDSEKNHSLHINTCQRAATRYVLLGD